jgi:hypothetical protein
MPVHFTLPHASRGVPSPSKRADQKTKFKERVLGERDIFSRRLNNGSERLYKRTTILTDHPNILKRFPLRYFLCLHHNKHYKLIADHGSTIRHLVDRAKCALHSLNLAHDVRFVFYFNNLGEALLRGREKVL